MAAFIVLMKAVTELIGAIAWPAVALAFGVYYRKPLKELLCALPTLVTRVEKLKLAGVEAELSRQAAAVDVAAIETPTPTLPPEQRDAADRVRVDARALPLEDIARIVADLADEYEHTRNTMPSSQYRTVRMGKTVAKMRAISLAALPLLDELLSSESEGKRLAAIVILQLQPKLECLVWLGKRFDEETPFVFYHAAIALYQAAHKYGSNFGNEILTVVAEAEAILRAFTGEPDANSLLVLEKVRHLIGPYRV